MYVNVNMFSSTFMAGNQRMLETTYAVTNTTYANYNYYSSYIYIMYSTNRDRIIIYIKGRIRMLQ